ncbi:MAG: alpha/beta fold hydrolase [Candidatus Eisenbacteria bacterium]|nr:alpha/beta fold hydrolase [Candidatus Eisenbacteria bacterium]
MLDHSVHGDPANPPLVLLHSGGMTRREWDPYLPGLGRDLRLVVPTALGHGSSPFAERFAIRAMGEAVLRLLDHLAIPRAHLLGSSMGGATALWIALHHPERVEKLIVFRSSYRSSPSTRDAVAKMAEPETWQRWGLESFVRREHQPQGGPDAWREVTRKVVAMLHGPESDRNHTLEELARMPQPTLLIAGDRDPVVPLEEVVAMYRTIQSAALWIAPNATHFLGTDSWRRDAFESEVLRFLRRT